MTDRIIREDLGSSDRWLDLPSDTHRLVYAPLLLWRADDFGNLEGGAQLWRFIRERTTLETPEAFAAVMAELAKEACDLARRYLAGNKEYWHLPRFKNRRRYTARKHPASPWDDPQQRTTIELLNQNKPDSENPAASLPQSAGNPAVSLVRGVGVGVGVSISNVGEKGESLRGGELSTSNPVDKIPGQHHPHRPNGATNQQWWKTDSDIERMAQALGIAPQHGDTYASLAGKCFDALRRKTTKRMPEG